MRSATVAAWLGLALLSACNKPPPTAEIRPVRTVTAVAGSEGEPVSLTGHIRARTEESLAFRIDGRMIKRGVEVGQVVRPNDLIAAVVPMRNVSVADLYQRAAHIKRAPASPRMAPTDSSQ